jgi:hypothetical protein
LGATSIAGHTANTLAKLRANVVAGNPPPAVQLKGPDGTGFGADPPQGLIGRD